MIANDLSDIFMIPLSNMIGSQIWNVIESSNLFLVPIIFVMCSTVLQCRAAGVDEGTPSIQAYKKIESYILGVIVIIFFACKMIPDAKNSSGYRPSEISVKNVTCQKEEFGVFSGINKSLILQSPFVNNLPSAPPTLWEALLNQFSVGMTNAAIASIPCDASSKSSDKVNIREALDELDTYEPENPKLNALVQQYDMQCYEPAMKIVADEQLSNTSSNPVKRTDLAFNGSDTKRIYDKKPGANGVSTSMVATFDIGLWPEMANTNNTEKHFFSSDKISVGCREIAEHISDGLRDDIANGEGKFLFKSVEGLRHKDSGKLFENFLYTNIVKEKGGFSYKLSKYNNRTSTSINDIENTRANDGILESVRDTLNGTFAMASSAIESAKVRMYQMSAPLVISVIKASLIIVTPLLLFLTGFRAQTLLYCTIAYFSVDFTKFFLEFGAFLDEVIMSILDILSFQGDKTTMAVVGSMTYLSQIINYGIVGVWLLFASWMGVKIGNVMQPAQSVAESGSAGTSKAASMGAKTIIKSAKG